jgi:photosystem II stability/assembly factor-like uncharacterized protein
MHRLIISALAALICFVPAMAMASEPAQKTVEALFQEKAQLKGQQVQLKGKVVKSNNQIMGKNWIHLQDGTGAQGTNDITITTQDTAQVGDEVIIIGTVGVDVDFGSGYMYPLIVEKATVKKAQ